MDSNEFAKNLIDRILDKSEELNVAWRRGGETISIIDIIQLINDEAEMDYKRCPTYKNIYKTLSDYQEISPTCYTCEKYFSWFSKKNHRQHCHGKKDACHKYEGVCLIRE